MRQRLAAQRFRLRLRWISVFLFLAALLPAYCPAGEPGDADLDWMDDAWEAAVGLDPLLDDSWGDPDGDSLPNIDEFWVGTDPFAADSDGDLLPDGSDPAPLSRAAIAWGDPRFTNATETAFFRPAWLRSASRRGGAPEAGNAWGIAAADTNAFELGMLIDPSAGGAPGLRLDIVATGSGEAALALDLIGTNLAIVVTNALDNVLPPNGATNRNLAVPVPSGAAVAGLRLRRTGGAVSVARTILYLDVDGDGLDAADEELLGTSDLKSDTDEDLLCDRFELDFSLTAGNPPLDPLSPDSDGDGLGDAWTAMAGAGPSAAAARARLHTRVAAGESHTLFLADDRTVLAWGNNTAGCLGVDSFGDNRLLPTPVTGPDGSGRLGDVVSVAAGGSHSLALRADGSVWAWGNNADGRLGDNTSYDSSRPLQVHGPGDAGFLKHIVAIAAGLSHSLALRSDGTVWTWGANDYGKLGDNTTLTRRTPVQVHGPGDIGFLTGIVAIATFKNHNLALRNDGTVWAWGFNDHGRLGDGTTTTRHTPVQVVGPGGSGLLANVLAIAAGKRHSLALLGNGGACAWGSNESGRLGDGTNVNSPTPVGIVAAAGTGALHTVTLLADGANFSLAGLADGTLAAWGDDSQGELGNGAAGQSFTPQAVLGENGQGIFSNATQVAAGWDHVIVLRADGTVWTWGAGGGGRLGDGATQQRNTPVLVDLDGDGLRDDWEIGCLGGLGYGPADDPDGDGAANDAECLHGCHPRNPDTDGDGMPDGFELEHGLNPRNPADAGLNLDNDGLTNLEEYLAGTNPRLGIDAFEPPPALRIAASQNHSLYLTRSGDLLAWGDNADSKLGLGFSGGYTGIMTAVRGPAGQGWLDFATAMTAGDNFSAALTANHYLLAWGLNASGRLGDDTTLSRNLAGYVLTPDAGACLSNQLAVSSGLNHSISLDVDGTVWAWGAGGYGKLGNNSTADSRTPQRVHGPVDVDVLRSIVAVSAGKNHSLALDIDSCVWAWGYGDSGRLGDGMGVTRKTPVRVKGFANAGVLSNVTAIVAGKQHSMALLADGTVATWGLNDAGRLGDGTTANRFYPVRVVGENGVGLLTNIVAIAGGESHSLALDAEGAVWSWGANGAGQLGIDSSERSLTPVRVHGPENIGFLTNIAAIAAGFDHNLALSRSGILYAWGDNGRGRLGDGTTITRRTPVVVDGDQDGLPDTWELAYFANLAQGAGDDPDADGATNLQEYLAGTDPTHPDSDGDGLTDGAEAALHCNPLLRDTDGDGLSDGDEVLVYNTNPAARDSDLDGIPDGLELFYGRDPVAADPYATLPFHERFEFETVQPGPVDGQNGWEAFPPEAAIVQTNIVFAGTQAVAIENKAETNALLRHLFAAPGIPFVWADMRLQLFAATPPSNVTYAAAAFIDAEGRPCYYDGHRPPSNAWVTVTSIPPCAEGQWVRMTFGLDYLRHEWLLCVNGAVVADHIGFASPSSQLSSLAFLGNRAFIDDVAVSTQIPAGISSDWDLLPDDWELSHFGNLAQTELGDPDGDGITNYQEFMAGLDPTLPDSDGDSIPDGVELELSLDPKDPADGDLDLDGDGLSNRVEYGLGTRIDLADSDGDGLTDQAELTLGTNPLNRDSDNDGMGDRVEHDMGYDPVASNHYFRIDTSSTGTWATSFEPDEGYSTGLLDGQQGWRASSNVDVVAGFSRTGQQAMRISGEVSTNPPTGTASGTVGSEGRQIVWLTLYINARQGCPQIDTNNIHSAAIAFEGGRVTAYDGDRGDWVSSARQFDIPSNHWMRIDACLDYAAHRYLVCCDGLLALEGLRFARTNAVMLTRLAVIGATGPDSTPAHFDDIRISAFEPAGLDFDGDGLLNTDEYALGTDPRSGDSDGDGIGDYDEVHVHHTDPTVPQPDLDGDGLTNAEETDIYGTDPTLADSDGDGTNDLTLVAARAGIETVHRVGAWVEQGTALRATGSSGLRVEYGLDVPAGNVYRLALDLSNGDAAAGSNMAFRIRLSIDDAPLGWVTPVLGGAASVTGLVTPWLTPGPHLIRLAWLDQAYALKDLRIHEVRLEMVDTPGPAPAAWQTPLLAAGRDSDGDRLSDLTEIQTHGSLPSALGLQPLSRDSDADFLSDGDEALLFGLDPLLADSDTNGIPDAVAVATRRGVETAARYVTHITTDFTDAGDFLVWSDSTASSCAYDLEVTTPGIHLLEVTVRNWQADPPDDYKFDFRLALDTFEFGRLQVAGDVDRSGTVYVITPWLTAGAHRFKLTWTNRIVQGVRLSRPAIERVRLLAVDAADMDGDGLQDWMKTTLLASTADLDGDSIKDRDEVLVTLTDPACADTDMDGLSDGQERTAGTNPLNVDTDGDGLSDDDEIRGTGTNPLVADIEGVWSAYVTVVGSATVSHSSAWRKEGDDLVASTRGSVEYILDLPVADLPILRLNARHEWYNAAGDAVAPLSASDFLVYADGQYVGRTVLNAAPGSNGFAHAVLPYLRSGPHRIRLVWNVIDERLGLRLASVSLGNFGGADTDGDGIRDWVAASAALAHAIDLAPASSFLSPACIEGTARYPLLAAAASGTNAIPVRPGISGRWYADLPLDQSGSLTPLALSFENGVCTAATAVAWLPLDLLSAPDTPLAARLGDTLRFTVQPPEGASGGDVVVSIALDGVPVTTLQAAAGTPFDLPFDAPGLWTFDALWSGADGASSAHTAAIRVCAAPLPAANPACLLGRQRVWVCEGVSPGVVLESDPGVRITWSGTNSTLLVNRMYAEHFVVARAGAGGPILDSRRLAHFWIQAAVDSFMRVVEYRPTSQLWEVRMVTLDVPDDTVIELRIFVGGVTFDDLTIVRYVSGADLDQAADYRFRMIHPNSSSASTCHTIKAYQDGVFLGESFYTLVGLPEDLR